MVGKRGCGKYTVACGVQDVGGKMKIGMPLD
jgi:hypothetical protein